MLLDSSVAQGDDGVGDFGGLETVGSHQDGGLEFVGHTPQQLHDDLGRDGIKVAHRLVGQQQSGLVDERPGDGDALHLTAGELVGEPIAIAVEVDPGKTLKRSGARIRGSSQLERQLDIFRRREGGKELEELEDEADLEAPNAGQLHVREIGGRTTCDLHLSGGWEVHRPSKVQ